jgi:O-acetylhomoserine/O-acetylserine sulfhydrylase-like pyridoxal-dependent enzyme
MTQSSQPAAAATAQTNKVITEAQKQAAILSFGIKVVGGGLEKPEAFIFSFKLSFALARIDDTLTLKGYLEEMLGRVEKLQREFFITEVEELYLKIGMSTIAEKCGVELNQRLRRL